MVTTISIVSTRPLPVIGVALELPPVCDDDKTLDLSLVLPVLLTSSAHAVMVAKISVNIYRRHCQAIELMPWYLRPHTAAVPVHSPSCPHTLTSLPVTTLNPSLQRKMACA